MGDLGPEAAHCSELQLLHRNLRSITSICPGSSQSMGNNTQSTQPSSVSTEPGEGCAVGSAFCREEKPHSKWLSLGVSPGAHLWGVGGLAGTVSPRAPLPLATLKILVFATQDNTYFLLSTVMTCEKYWSLFMKEVMFNTKMQKKTGTTFSVTHRLASGICTNNSERREVGQDSAALWQPG